jgi:dihydroorotate dehydrogenase (NAD+) catalytic subunit
MMDKEISLQLDFAGLQMKTPVMTASGTCGYAEELTEFMDLSCIGGVITKSVTLKPRKGNPTPRIVETESGMLNAIGLANVGLDRFIAEKIPQLRQLNTNIFVNLAGQTIEDYTAVARRLSEEEVINGFELNISCPNVKEGGITFGTDPGQISKITTAVKKVCGTKVLVVKLTPSITNISVAAKAAVDAGADALSLINTFTAMVIDIEKRRPVLANRTGGLSGPAIKPIAVYMVNKVFNDVAKPAGIPIVGMGGIRTAADALEFIIAGASAVAVGTATFMYPDTAEKIVQGLSAYCLRHGILNIRDLIGSLH